MKIYDSPEYWCGSIGYKPPGYGDYVINTVKEICVLFYKPESVLDIGCACGYSINRLRTFGIPSFGLDISQYIIDHAYDSIKPYIKQGVVWDLPYKDKEFDLVFSSGMLEHVPKKKLVKSISEMCRVSKRGLVGVSATDDITTHKDDDDTHEIEMTLQEWRDLFPDGYTVISDSENSWRLYATQIVVYVSSDD